MPELPEVERVRLTLAPALTGSTFVRVRLRRPDLRRPFPAGFSTRLVGQTVEAVCRRGKYLVATLSSGDALLIHLGMSGSFRIERAPARGKRRADVVEERHDHVVFEMSSGVIVTFNDPRRFGLMDLLAASSPDVRGGFASLGPEPLETAFDATVLARTCARRLTPLKVLLLDQSAVAGVGNIYASEALHLALLSPLRRASSIATRDGKPRETAVRLVRAIKAVLRKAVARREQDDDGFRVYDREGERCPTRKCRGTIRRISQAGRSTFYCPVCQR